MRIVLDEGVPRQLVRALRELGMPVDPFDKIWRGKSNGILLSLVAGAGYDVLLTSDKNIADQQSLRGFTIAVVALPLNRRAAVMSRVDDIADTLRQASPGQHIVIGFDGSRIATRPVDGRLVVEALTTVSPFRI